MIICVEGTIYYSYLSYDKNNNLNIYLKNMAGEVMLHLTVQPKNPDIEIGKGEFFVTPNKTITSACYKTGLFAKTGKSYISPFKEEFEVWRIK